MSGSPGNFNGGGCSSDDSCEDINLVTQVNSPVDDVVTSLQKGDLLGVELLRKGAVESVVLTTNDEIAGTLVSERIRNCLSKGYSFEAQIEELDDGIFRVRVSSS